MPGNQRGIAHATQEADKAHTIVIWTSVASDLSQQVFVSAGVYVQRQTHVPVPCRIPKSHSPWLKVMFTDHLQPQAQTRSILLHKKKRGSSLHRNEQSTDIFSAWDADHSRCHTCQSVITINIYKIVNIIEGIIIKCLSRCERCLLRSASGNHDCRSPTSL